MASVDAEKRRSRNLVCDLVYTVLVHEGWLMVNKFWCYGTWYTGRTTLR